MNNKEMPLAIITGAGGGIGRDLGERLSAAGYAVALWDYDGGSVEARSAELTAAGRRSVWARCDVTDPAQVEAATKAAEEAFGIPYLLVNNAAVRHRMPLEDLPRESWDRELAVNLTGAFQCTQTVGRRMLAAGRGVIVNMASMAASFGQPVRGAYSPSKAGILGLTGVTAVEWGARGIRCNAVSPGMIATPVHSAHYSNDRVRAGREAMIPLGRLGNGSDVADVVVFLASDAARYINGANLPVDGGVTSSLIGLMPIPTADGGTSTTLAELAAQRSG